MDPKTSERLWEWYGPKNIDGEKCQMDPKSIFHMSIAVEAYEIEIRGLRAEINRLSASIKLGEMRPDMGT